MGSDNWQIMPFDEAVQINPHVPLIRGKVYPFVDMQSVDPSSRGVAPSGMREFKGGGSRFMIGDTLMARITPCLENGKIARFLGDGKQNLGHGSTEFIVIRGRPGVTENDYAYYLTKWNRVREYAISQMTGTSGRQRVPVEALSHLEVPVPPLSEQRAIAHILGTLDDKIEFNRRMNETLEAMARALFKSWFVDFDPVIDNALEAGNPIPDVLAEKAERRLALGDKRKALPEHIRRLFPDRFVDSELGPIPEGWKVAPLPEVIEINPPRRLHRGAIAPYLEMANMPTRSARVINFYYREFESGTRFIDGDTLLARITPCLENGKVCFVDFLGEGKVGWGSTEYIVLRSKPPLPLEYSYFLARTDKFRSFAIANMTGTSGRQRLSPSSLAHFDIVVPEAKVVRRFGEFARAVFSKMKSNDEESCTLAAIRDTLLPKLISGEIQVKYVQQLLEGKDDLG